jgi:hypothetical protein
MMDWVIWTIPLSLTPLTHKDKGRVILISQSIGTHDIDGNAKLYGSKKGPFAKNSGHPLCTYEETQNGISLSFFTHKD